MEGQKESEKLMEPAGLLLGLLLAPPQGGAIEGFCVGVGAVVLLVAVLAKVVVEIAAMGAVLTLLKWRAAAGRPLISTRVGSLRKNGTLCSCDKK